MYVSTDSLGLYLGQFKSFGFYPCQYENLIYVSMRLKDLCQYERIGFFSSSFSRFFFFYAVTCTDVKERIFICASVDIVEK